MSKKMLFNDNEVVFNEDVASAQNWRQRDFNRSLEAQWRGTFGQGPLTAGTIVGASVVSGLNMIRSAVDLSVLITTGTALFGFGGTNQAVNNIYQLASSEATTTLKLGVADALLTRWDLIEVSAEKVTTSEEREVLVPAGPFGPRRLVNVLIPKLEENRLKFRIRSGAGTLLAGDAVLPALQPDAAWLPLYAIRVLPLALTASAAEIYDLRLWLSNFSSTDQLSTLVNNWKSAPSLAIDSLGGVQLLPNQVTIGGYTSPAALYSLGTTPARLYFYPNSQKPSGLIYQIDKWYYIYASRPHRNCGNVVLTISDQAPPSAFALPNGTRAGLALPAPWPFESSSLSHYVCAVKLYELGGGSYAFKEFHRSGNFVSIASVLEGVGPPGADTLNKAVSQGSVTGTISTSVNPGLPGTTLIPPHARMVRMSWHIKAAADPVVFTILTSNDFVVETHLLAALSRSSVSVDIPLPPDGSTAFKYKVTGGVVAVEADVTGYYEDMS